MQMRASTVVQQLCKSCGTCFKFYCMFYFTCDRSFELPTAANRAFKVVGPRIWNNLSDDVTSAESIYQSINKFLGWPKNKQLPQGPRKEKKLI